MGTDMRLWSCWFASSETETMFWSSPFAAKRLLSMERWGLSTVMLLNLARSLSHYKLSLLRGFVFAFMTTTSLLILSVRLYLVTRRTDIFFRYRLV
jgi:hypothetical protein